jgi:hypothetical protein
MSAHISWPQGVDNAPVHIEIGRSANEILVEGYVTSIIKTRGVENVGVMLDADTNPTGRYIRLRDLCSSLFPTMPNSIPGEGLIVENENGQRLGVWIMPDNSSQGNLETFLKYLVPADSKPIWDHGIESLARAKELGASCRDCHDDKASLFTWLAWQDPPGQKAGAALTQRVLDPRATSAEPFVSWFRGLYRL